jgi:hypothetical protein
MRGVRVASDGAPQQGRPLDRGAAVAEQPPVEPVGLADVDPDGPDGPVHRLAAALGAGQPRQFPGESRGGLQVEI